MIKLAIDRGEGGWINRFYLRFRDPNTHEYSKPVWNEERRTFEFEKFPPDHNFWLTEGPSEFQILELMDNDSGEVGQMLQTLCDDLWQMGIRPSNSVDRTDTIKAQDKHIEDLNEARKDLTKIAERAIERIPND
jgi:hypothetical protein